MKIEYHHHLNISDGGGGNGNTTGNCYICSGCGICTLPNSDATHGEIPAKVLYIDTSYAVIGTKANYNNSTIYKIFRDSQTNKTGYKLIKIVDYGDTPLILGDYAVDDKNYYLDMLPSCWLSYMLSTSFFDIKYVYRLPIR